MFWQIYVFLGLLALATSAVAINQRVPVDVKVAGATAGFLLWTLWGLSSYSVEIITDGGTVVTHTYEALVLVGLTTAAVMLGYAIWTAMAMFGMDPKRLLSVRL